MTNITDEYDKQINIYRNKYGRDTIVLLQVGDFYEVYADRHDEEQITVFRDILKLSVTNKNGKIASGFRYNMYKYYEKRVLYNGYTIIYVDQVIKLFPYRRKVWEVREVIQSRDAYLHDSGFSMGTCLFASCCPGWYAHDLRTFD
jgi:DNA mismatch repair ATPase MutS